MCTGLSHQIAAGSTDRIRYQEIIGCLLFISTQTRPDIAASVGIICRLASNPKAEHFVAAKRVLRYLRGTSDMALVLNLQSSTLVSFADDNWGSDTVDRKSTSGIVMFIGGCPVVWKMSKQSVVALSSSEAEFVAAREAVKQILWMRHILGELGLAQDEPTVLYQDNQGSMAWETTGIRRAKHVAIRGNFVMSQVEKNVLNIFYCNTQNMVADILMKPLSRLLFERHRNGLGVRKISTAHQNKGGELDIVSDRDKCPDGQTQMRRWH